MLSAIPERSAEGKRAFTTRGSCATNHKNKRQQFAINPNSL